MLLLLVGTDVYRVLVLDLGWSHEAWVEWTVASVAEQVFAVGTEAA